MFLSVYSAYDVIAICLKHMYMCTLHFWKSSYKKVILILCFNPTLYYGMLIFIGIKSCFYDAQSYAQNKLTATGYLEQAG